MTAFEEFGVLPEIAKAVEEMDWTLPTDVQAEAIPLILGGGDVLMAAETGSGKTGAFCLPLLQVVWESLKDLEQNKKGGGSKQTTSSAASSTSSPSSGWAMSAFDRSPELAVSADGLSCQSRNQKDWHGSRAAKGVAGRGRFYYEASVQDEGLCRLGFATTEASLDLGTCPNGFGFGGTGKKSNNRQFDDYGGAFGKGDVIGCYLDLDNHEIAFTKNGVDLGLAFSFNKSFKGKPFYPAVVLKNAEMQFNFGDKPFKYAPVEDYIGFASAPDKAVVDNPKACQTAVERKHIPNAPQAIIIEPSRELAEQTLNQIRLFKKHLGAPIVRELLVMGGVAAGEQVAALRSGVDIVVATPGRLEELISTKEMSMRQCRFFVLDEADGLLKAGYEKMIERLHSQIPKMTSDGTRLQMIVCSATLHDMAVKKLADRFMHFPTWVDLKGQDSVPETVHHVVVRVDPTRDRSWQGRTSGRAGAVVTDAVHARDRMGNDSKETLSEAVKLLKADYCLLAIKQHKMDYGMIFCRTKVDCDNLESFLKHNSYSCVCLHGDRKPQERQENLKKFKEQQVSFLICTDVAARGIDVRGVPYMVNVNVPDDKSNYVHRIGRVGRAERMGLAITLVATVPEKVWYHGEWCSSRGRNCSNTRLTTENGCCVWLEDLKLLDEVEEHLGVTIAAVDKSMVVETDEFDGKVVYGRKREATGTGYAGHAGQLAGTLAHLQKMERDAQLVYLQNFG